MAEATDKTPGTPSDVISKPGPAQDNSSNRSRTRTNATGTAVVNILECSASGVNATKMRNEAGSSVQVNSTSLTSTETANKETAPAGSSSGDDIPQDSFSMFFVAEKVQEHLLPIFVFVLQMIILFLMYLNLMQNKDGLRVRFLNIPVDVHNEMTTAQYVACLVSVFTADDFVSGICFMTKKITKVGASEPAPDCKWVFCNIVKMLEGGCTIVVSFILIVQSTTVIELFLNFAGVTFVSLLDAVTFQLAAQSFLGNDARKLADKVDKCKVESKGEGGEDKKWKYLRITLFAAVVIAMFGVLTWVVIMQNTLHYACKSVQITIGADGLQEFSGRYIFHETTLNQRAVYVQEQGRGAILTILGYCDREKRWTVIETDQRDPDRWDLCKENTLQSERTTTYDITQIRELQLYSGENVNGNLKCSDCSMKLRRESCGWHGKCTEDTAHAKACVCDDNRFGDSCQFTGPCTELRFQDHEFPGYQKSFNLLAYENRPLFVHDRPTYIQGDTDSEPAVLLYNGGRWLVVLSTSFEDWERAEKTLIEYLEQDFSSRDHEYVTEFISESTSEGIPGNVPFRAMFTEGEEDFTVGKLGNEKFLLLCADCDDCTDCGGQTGDASYCMNTEGNRDGSLCQEKVSPLHNTPVFRCQCETGFIGPLCQTRPVEGKLLLHLEHGGANMCSVCGEHNELTVRDLLGSNNETCLPFPREPFRFEGANDTIVSRQLGLNLNNTHYSVFIASSQTFFHQGKNDGATDLICSIQEGSKEIYSIRRSEAPREQTHLGFAVLLDANNNFFGEVIGSSGINCFKKSRVSENLCVGSEGNGTLSQVYGYDALLQKSNLVRAWIQFDLKVTQ